MAEIMRLWAKLGSDRRQQLRKVLARLIRLSDRNLKPLRDPLHEDFRTHRWLRMGHETAYSDWLAWILEKLERKLLFRLLGIDEPKTVARCKGVTLRIEREFPVPGGYVDILIEYRDVALIILEIKKADAEATYSEQLRKYKKWLDQQKRIPMCRCAPRGSEG